jgi:hypothetical protein
MLIQTKLSRDIVNGQCRTLSRRIEHALEIHEHLWNTVCTPEWAAEHQHTKINEMACFFIDELVMNLRFSAVEPVYSCLSGISGSYCFMMLPGEGHVAQRRFSCWCDGCCIAFETNAAELGLHEINGCVRAGLTKFEAARITCSAAVGIANAKMRAKGECPAPAPVYLPPIAPKLAAHPFERSCSPLLEAD